MRLQKAREKRRKFQEEKTGRERGSQESEKNTRAKNRTEQRKWIATYIMRTENGTHRS